jgi:hypothetical protein
MNLQHAARQATVSRERQHETDTHVHGRWLLLARIVWFALVALTLSVYITSLPEYLTKLQTVCRLAACGYGQLSPETVVALQRFGPSCWQLHGIHGCTRHPHSFGLFRG